MLFLRRARLASSFPSHYCYYLGSGRRSGIVSGSSIETVFSNKQQRHHQSHAYNSPGRFDDRETGHKDSWAKRDWNQRGFTVGIGGPVGSGKTALVLRLVQELRCQFPWNLAVVTNDIFTQEDAEFLIRQKALPANRIVAVETGGCPHAAIREDVSANLGALERLTRDIRRDEQQQQQQPALLLCESGGDNLAASFSRELADFTVYVIDVAGGDKVPRKGGPGITQSDVLVINKTDLAEAVGADLGVMRRDADRMRGVTGDGNSNSKTTIFASVRHGIGIDAIKEQILTSYRMATTTTGNTTQ